MASDNSSPQNESLEHQDQSIKDRKSQLFSEEPRSEVDDFVRRPFSHYVRKTPAAPLSAGVKASLWAVAVLVALLFIAALSTVGKKPKKPRAAALTPAPSAAAWYARTVC